MLETFCSSFILFSFIYQAAPCRTLLGRVITAISNGYYQPSRGGISGRLSGSDRLGRSDRLSGSGRLSGSDRLGGSDRLSESDRFGGSNRFSESNRLRGSNRISELDGLSVSDRQSLSDLPNQTGTNSRNQLLRYQGGRYNGADDAAQANVVARY